MRAAHILQLGLKELRGVARDPMMIALIIYSFTLSVYTAATAIPDTLHKAAIAIVDEDNSPVASRIVGESLHDETRQRGIVDRFLAELESGDIRPTAAGRSGGVPAGDGVA